MSGFNSVASDKIEIEETEYDGSGSGSGDSFEDDYFELVESGAEEEQGHFTFLIIPLVI